MAGHAEAARRRRRFAPLLAAAAVLVLVAGGVIVATNQDSDEDPIAAVVEADDAVAHSVSGPIGDLEFWYSPEENAVVLVGDSLEPRTERVDLSGVAGERRQLHVARHVRARCRRLDGDAWRMASIRPAPPSESPWSRSAGATSRRRRRSPSRSSDFVLPDRPIAITGPVAPARSDPLGKVDDRQDDEDEYENSTDAIAHVVVLLSPGARIERHVSSVVPVRSDPKRARSHDRVRVTGLTRPSCSVGGDV